MKANNVTTTMSTPIEEVLKSDIMREVYVEADGEPAKVPPAPTPKQIGGLTNLGKTFIWSEAELEDKRKYVDAQMVQKYGAEIYGVSAQLSSGGDKGLISCSVSPFVDLTHVKSEAKGGGFQKLKDSRDKIQEFFNGKKDKWIADNIGDKKAVRTLQDTIYEFRDTGGVADEQNQRVWAKLDQLFKSEPWSKLAKTDGEFKALRDSMVAAWTEFNGGDKDGKVDSNITTHVSKNKLDSNKTTNQPNVAMRITIQTKFDDNWYKNKFKSGFLNKMIFAIKTDAMSHGSPDVKSSMAGHEYKKDEMLPQDIRKLDSIKWKMTNKVAKDYISLLLGWSRKKTYTVEGEDDVKTPMEELKPNRGLGDSLAKKALGGRGFLGRLKQQLFSGQQKSESISVAFQFADPNDGWDFVESKKSDPGPDGEEGGEGGSSKGGSSSGSSGSGGKGGGSSGPSSSSPLYRTLTPDQAQKNPDDATKNLAARVKRLEDEVGITPPTSESTDPFEEAFMEGRMELVKEVCEGKADVQVLIEHCLTNDWGN